MKSENMSTMRRRKVIADSKGERDAASTASDQVDSLELIGLKLDDVQSANELVAEVIEEKGNNLIDSVDNVAEGTELAAEASERTTESIKTLTGVASTISDKLSRLASMLESKVQAVEQKVQESGASTSTGLSVIEDKLPDPDEPESPGLPERILPPLDDNNNLPDEDFFPPVPQEPENNKKDQKKDDKKPTDMLGDLLKTTKGGFKATISITDKISSMLFKYTVTALAEAAKMAAMLFALVLGIDLLRIHFKYWTDKFMSNFDEFSAEAGEWGGLLQSIFGMLGDIKKFWEAGDWSGLAVAIVKGLADVIYNLSEIMSLGISKISASILDALGFENAATTIRGSALEGFQERTGNSLSEDDQKALAKYQSKRIEEGPGIIDKAGEFKTRAFDWVLGRENKIDSTQASDRDQETQNLKAMAPEKREETLIKQNEARAAVQRLEKYIGDVDPENPTNMQSLEKAYNSAKKAISDSAISDQPATKKELDKRFQRVESKYQKLKEDNTPKPAAPATSEDNQRVQNIQKAENAKEQSKKSTGDMNVANTQVNNVNNSKTIHQVQTVTATPAPGVFGATGVN